MQEKIHTIGRRKTSIIRLYMDKGSGNITVNNRDYKKYFPTAVLQNKINQPLVLTESTALYNIKAHAEGGGVTGQAEALRLAIARALAKVNPENRAKLKPHNLFTRDARMVERKKFGRKKARKGFQFTKR